jgi:hypothetical protein
LPIRVRDAFRDLHAHGQAWRPAEKIFTPAKTTPRRSDHLDSVPRLEPTDRRVIDGVGKRNLAQRLTCCHTLQGFARLMLGQLRLPAKSYAFAMARARPSLSFAGIKLRSNSAMPDSTVSIRRLRAGQGARI